MRAAFALVLVIGMLLAGAAVYLTKGYLGQQEAALREATAMADRMGPMVRVYATKKAMPFGTPITKDDIQEVFVQRNFLPEGAFLVNTKIVLETEGDTPPAPPAILVDEDPKKPRYLLRSVEPNEVIIASRVTEPGQQASLTGKLAAGMRAFQIRMDTGSGVQGVIMPDGYIDIYWTGASEQGEVTRLIESAIKVIAVDGASGEGQQMTNDGGPQTVTVAATPEQVARLAQAQATGRLNMSLVASAEDAASGLIEVNRDKLLGVERPAEVAKTEEPKICSIKTRKGDVLVEVPIPCTN